MSNILMLVVLQWALVFGMAHAQAGPEITISAAQRARLDAEIAQLPVGLRGRFETLYQDWKNSWEQPGIRISSNPAARRNTVEFRTLLSLGPQTLPLVVDKLLQRDEFFALQLYDVLQDRPGLRADEHRERRAATRVGNRPPLAVAVVTTFACAGAPWRNA